MDEAPSVTCCSAPSLYSDTHARGSSRFDRLMQAAQMLRGREGAAAALASLREAALRDAEGKALEQRWRALGLPLVQANA